MLCSSVLLLVAINVASRVPRCHPTPDCRTPTILPYPPYSLYPVLQPKRPAQHFWKDTIGWILADLRSLPDELLGWLADLLREVEQLGKWPARLAEGYTALIPKEGPPGPLSTHPLTVLSMVRCFAAPRSFHG